MDSPSERLSVYRELADNYDRLGQVSMRDRFLILAADASLESGDPSEAERLRQRLLQASRYHMLRPYQSFAEAVGSPDVQTYLRDLRANYPLNVAKQLLGTLHSNGTAAAPPAAVLPFVNPGSPPAVPTENAIPATAPLIDLYGRSSTGRPTWSPAIPGDPVPSIDPIEMTPAPPVFQRPLAQPLPGRTPTARNPSLPIAASTIPLAPLSPPPATRPARTISAAPPKPVEPPPPAGGNWFAFALVGVVVAVGAVLAAYTMARPFLPPGWPF